MTAARDPGRALLDEILDRVLSARERIAAIDQGSGDGADRRSPAAAAAFRDAAAMAAPPAPAHPAECRRLASVFRSGDPAAIAAEPQLTGPAEVLDLGRHYFTGASASNGPDATRPVAALRDLLTDDIAGGLCPELKPDFRREYLAFEAEYRARSRSTGDLGG